MFTDASAKMDYVKSCASPVVVKAMVWLWARVCSSLRLWDDAVAAVNPLRWTSLFGDSGNQGGQLRNNFHRPGSLQSCLY